MSIEIKSALTNRIGDLLNSFVTARLIKDSDADTIKGLLMGVNLDDDTVLFSVLSSLLGLGYNLWKIETGYNNGKVLLSIHSQRRVDSLSHHNDIPICATNDKALMNLDLFITDMGGSLCMSAEMKISHEVPDETWILISPFSMSLDRFDSMPKIIGEENKVVELWKLAHKLYS